MARYKVTEVSEVLRTWFVEADSEESAEALVYGPIGGSPDKETGETIEMDFFRFCEECNDFTATGVECLENDECRSCGLSCSTCGTVKE